MNYEDEEEIEHSRQCICQECQEKQWERAELEMELEKERKETEQYHRSLERWIVWGY